MTDIRPRAYQFWPSAAQDAYDERVAIGCDDCRVELDQPVPWPIQESGIRAAELEIQLMKKAKV